MNYNKKESWTSEENFMIGWSSDKKGEIDWLAYRGDSEEIQEIKEIIHKFKNGKDYTYSPDEETEAWGKVEKYTIHNSELKKNLWELVQEEEINIPDIPEVIKPLLDDSPFDFPIEPIEPIKPIKPIRPFGKPKENEKWKEYRKRMEEYWERMNEFCKRIEDYNRRMQDYNKRLKNKVQKVTKKFNQDPHKEANNKSLDREYVRKFCPHCGIKKVISTDKYCSYCSTRLGAIIEKENKNQWKWREFWVGVSVALILGGISLLLIKLFKKKK